MFARNRFLALCMMPVLYVAVAAIQSTGGGSNALASLFLLPFALFLAFRFTEPRSIGEDLV
nr:hypothetical protein [Polyangiaceae bacterium]